MDARAQRRERSWVGRRETCRDGGGAFFLIGGTPGRRAPIAPRRHSTGKGKIAWPRAFPCSSTTDAPVSPVAVRVLTSAIKPGRSSPQSPHVFRGGFKLPKHLKSPLHAPEEDGQAPLAIGHTSPLLHESRFITGLQPTANDGERAPTSHSRWRRHGWGGGKSSLSLGSSRRSFRKRWLMKRRREPRTSG